METSNNGNYLVPKDSRADGRYLSIRHDDSLVTNFLPHHPRGYIHHPPCIALARNEELAPVSVCANALTGLRPAWLSAAASTTDHMTSSPVFFNLGIDCPVVVCLPNVAVVDDKLGDKRGHFGALTSTKGIHCD